MKAPSPVIVIALFLALTFSAGAQVLTPGKSSPSSGGNQGTNSRGSGSSSSSNDTTVLGSDLPFFDAGTETFSWDGRTWNVLDNRLFSARFEKYLAAPEATNEEDSQYREILDQILQTLSPLNRDPGAYRDAVRLLPEAALYYNDAKLCDSLLNAIYGVELARNNVDGLNEMNLALEKKLKDLRRSYEVGAAETGTDAPQRKLKDDPKKEEEKGVTKPGVEFSRVGGYMARIVELEALRVANKTKGATSELQSKIEFQALLVQFFLQRRLEHVVMGARFYRRLFGDGTSNLMFEEGSDTKRTFAESLGFNPTVATLETTANEIIRDVDEGVEAFTFHVEKSELESGSKRLSEAFVMGEYLPKIRTLPREEKTKVLQFVRDTNQLLSAIEVKDYGLAETLVTRLREASTDFDYSKPLAAIETAKRVSSMRIRKAKNAAMAGDTDTYEENIKVATEIWPTNPELAREFDVIADQADTKSLTLNDFDRLLATRSYRQIFDDQARYIAASIGDKEREEQLKEVLENIKDIERAIYSAERLVEVGDKYGAWETVDEMHDRFSDDPNLSAYRSELTTEVSPFVSALKEAERLEEREQLGSALTWYLKARKLYLNSSNAKEGIDRLSEQILPDQ